MVSEMVRNSILVLLVPPFFLLFTVAMRIEMMRISSLLMALALVAASLSVLPAEAQYRGGAYAPGRYVWGANGTQFQLQQQINNGLRTGRLTKSEAAKLQAKLNKINMLELRYRGNDNRLSRNEREKLNNQLADLSRDIQRELNDFDQRWMNRHRTGSRPNWNR